MMELSRSAEDEDAALGEMETSSPWLEASDGRWRRVPLPLPGLLLPFPLLLLDCDVLVRSSLKMLRMVVTAYR